MLRRLSFHLSGAQLGITVTSLVLGFVAEPTIARAIEGPLEQVAGDAGRASAVAVALLVATVVQMVLGELVPKSLAISNPTGAAYALVQPIRLYGVIAKPVIYSLNAVADWMVRRLGIEPAEELRSVRNLQELDLLFRSSGEEGTLDHVALRLLDRAVRFSDKTAADALIPRPDVVAVSVDDTVAELAARSVETGFSRFPVYDGDMDQVEGIVHVKDAFRIPYGDRPSTSVRSLVTDATVVPETMELSDLLVALQERATHLAIVIDEYGSTAGVITLEDVLEELVGEIADEHDPDLPPLTRVHRPGQWRLPGGLHRDEVFDACGLEVPDGPYETLAGFVLDRLGRVPEAGDSFEHDGWRLAVLAVDGRRIATVEVVSP